MAAGDFTFTVPLSLASLRADRIVIERTRVTVDYFDNMGRPFSVCYRNGVSQGIAVVAGQIRDGIDIPTPTGFTQAIGALTVTNAKMTALTALGVTLGTLSATGTVD
jgi:hypothetical protein